MKVYNRAELLKNLNYFQLLKTKFSHSEGGHSSTSGCPPLRARPSFGQGVLLRKPVKIAYSKVFFKGHFCVQMDTQ